MSLENNMSDFENALDKMKDYIESLESCINEDIMDTIKSVINEYETHYKSDIEDLISENESMKDQLEQSNDKS